MLEPRLLHQVCPGRGPTVGLAVHAGHEIRPDLLRFMEISEAERLREEDPFTDVLAFACDWQLLTRRSRFEVDLNRRREEALCVQPEDCWGLKVWDPEAARQTRPALLEEHDAFYARLERLLCKVERRHGRFVVFDLHSYNHRREGPDAAPAPAAENPEINLGTGSMDREFWAPVADRFIAAMRKSRVDSHALDVRENVRFRGREVARFVHQRFPRSGCALAIEVKKTFMDEWSGAVDEEHLAALRGALAGAARAAAAALDEVKS